ncbi:MAG: GNAT family N-acetyltransferase [Bryobacteraceae bacterium]
MNLHWVTFLQHAARHSSKGSIRQFDGLEAAWVHSPLLINNGTYLTSPPSDVADLQRRMAAAREDARPHNLPWAFYIFEPYVASLSGEEVAAAAAACGLGRMMGVQVMTADVQELLPPRRPLPDVEFRRISNREECGIALDINTRAYGLPPFITEGVLETGAYFSDPDREFGFIALAGGVPVSTATVIALDGLLYVALVATEADHRKKGYAEAVMRHALSEAASALGLARTALDASAAGAPLYRQMGYQDAGAAWSLYTTA